jgi:uncharacterized SAM-binding protein YcdF (DUF218 family)
MLSTEPGAGHPMYFIASKIVGFFVVPSNLILTFTVCGLLLWRTRFAKSGRRIVIASIILLLITGGTPLGTALLLPLENRFKPWDSSRGAPTGVIILGGIISPEISVQRGEISLGGASERIIAVVELYHRYPNVRIVFAGGNPNVIFHAPPESEFAARMLENLGIRRERIELESSSRNTRENAINTMKLVMPKPGERWLLITSAYHMPRAIGLFRKIGFPVEAYPVDWQTGGWSDLVPMSFSFLGETNKLDLAVHEWAGLIFDWLSGRTSAIFPGQ